MRLWAGWASNRPLGALASACSVTTLDSSSTATSATGCLPACAAPRTRRGSSQRECRPPRAPMAQSVPLLLRDPRRMHIFDLGERRWRRYGAEAQSQPTAASAPHRIPWWCRFHRAGTTGLSAHRAANAPGSRLPARDPHPNNRRCRWRPVQRLGAQIDNHRYSQPSVSVPLLAAPPSRRAPSGEGTATASAGIAESCLVDCHHRTTVQTNKNIKPPRTLQCRGDAVNGGGMSEPKSLDECSSSLHQAIGEVLPIG